MAVAYRALVGVDYPGGRCEAGDESDALPAKSVKWLLEQGLIERVDAGAPSELLRLFTLVSVVEGGKRVNTPELAVAVDPEPSASVPVEAPQNAATPVLDPLEG